MLLLLASEIPSTPMPARVSAQPTATVRIERAAVANEQEWRRTAKKSQRKIVIRDEAGNVILVRVIEHE